MRSSTAFGDWVRSWSTSSVSAYVFFLNEIKTAWTSRCFGQRKTVPAFFGLQKKWGLTGDATLKLLRMSPSFSCECPFRQHVFYSLCGVVALDCERRVQQETAHITSPEEVCCSFETGLIVRHLPWLIILITASLSSNTNTESSRNMLRRKLLGRALHKPCTTRPRNPPRPFVWGFTPGFQVPENPRHVSANP